MIKKIIYIFLFFIIAAIATGIYLWNKPHKNIETTKEDFVLSAVDFYKEYSADETTANKKYLNKVIIVSGKIAEIQLENPDEPSIAIETGTDESTINCGFKKEFLNDLKALKTGEIVKIKGKCDGFSMFGIVFTQCNLEK
ncbi:MAG: hypothetical protein HUU47_06405 [Bacteroidetes bacterium]|nr:hypothetical protein [Bacteroidota bacterium]